MRRGVGAGFAGVAFISTLALYGGGTGIAARAAALEPKSESVAVDSLVDAAAIALCGEYRPIGAPSRVVMISFLGFGVTRVSLGDGWESVGYFDGGTYRGVARGRGRGTAPSTLWNQGELRFKVGPDRLIRSELSIASGEPERSEVWRRRIDLVPDQNAPREDSATDTLPKFGEVVHIDRDVVPIHKVPPDYPKEMRERGLDGVVVLQVLVGRDGLVKDARVTKSLPGFDEAALRAVSQWEFQPAEVGGAPVAVWTTVPMRFSLH